MMTGAVAKTKVLDVCERVERILLKWDPDKLVRYGATLDEYRVEAIAITLGLGLTHSQKHLRALIRWTFLKRQVAIAETTVAGMAAEISALRG